MSFSGPLKASVLKENLPPITVFKDGKAGYNVRYRIVSADLNRFSSYSPIYRVIPNYLYERPVGTTESDLEVLTSGPYVNLVWDPITIKDRVEGTEIRQALEYDIFLNWSKGETNPAGRWFFQETVEGTQVGFRFPDRYFLEDGTEVIQKPNRLSAEIYLRSTNPSRSNSVLRVYSANNVTV